MSVEQIPLATRFENFKKDIEKIILLPANERILDSSQLSPVGQRIMQNAQDLTNINKAIDNVFSSIAQNPQGFWLWNDIGTSIKKNLPEYTQDYLNARISDFIKRYEKKMNDTTKNYLPQNAAKLIKYEHDVKELLSQLPDDVDVQSVQKVFIKMVDIDLDESLNQSSAISTLFSHEELEIIQRHILPKINNDEDKQSINRILGNVAQDPKKLVKLHISRILLGLEVNNEVKDKNKRKLEKNNKNITLLLPCFLKLKTEISRSSELEVIEGEAPVFKSQLWGEWNLYISEITNEEQKPYVEFLQKLDVYAYPLSTEENRYKQVNEVRTAICSYLTAQNLDSKNVEHAKLLGVCAEVCKKISSPNSRLKKIIFSNMESVTKEKSLEKSMVPVLKSLEKYNSKINTLFGSIGRNENRKEQVREVREALKKIFDGTPEEKITALSDLRALRNKITEKTSELREIINKAVKIIEENQSAIYSKAAETQVHYNSPEFNVGERFEEVYNLEDNSYLKAFIDNVINSINPITLKEFPKALSTCQMLVQKFQEKVDTVNAESSGNSNSAINEKDVRIVMDAKATVLKKHNILFYSYVVVGLSGAQISINEKYEIIHSDVYTSSKEILSENKMLTEVREIEAKINEDYNKYKKEKIEQQVDRIVKGFSLRNEEDVNSKREEQKIQLVFEGEVTSKIKAGISKKIEEYFQKLKTMVTQPGNNAIVPNFLDLYAADDDFIYGGFQKEELSDNIRATIKTIWKEFLLLDSSIKQLIITEISRSLAAIVINGSNYEQQFKYILNDFKSTYKNNAEKDVLYAKVVKNLLEIISNNKISYTEFAEYYKNILYYYGIHKDIIDKNGEVFKALEAKKQSLVKEIKERLKDNLNKEAYNDFINLSKKIESLTWINDLILLVDEHVKNHVKENISSGNFKKISELFKFLRELKNTEQFSSLNYDYIYDDVAQAVKTLIANNLQAGNYTAIKALFDFVQKDNFLKERFSENSEFWQAQKVLITAHIFKSSEDLINANANKDVVERDYSELGKLFAELETSGLYEKGVLDKSDVQSRITGIIKQHITEFLQTMPNMEASQVFLNKLKTGKIYRLIDGAQIFEEILNPYFLQLSKHSEKDTALSKSRYIRQISSNEESSFDEEKNISEEFPQRPIVINKEEILDKFMALTLVVQRIGGGDKFDSKDVLSFDLGNAAEFLLLNQDEEDVKAALEIFAEAVEELNKKQNDAGNYCFKTVMALFLQEIRLLQRVHDTKGLSKLKKAVFEIFKNLLANLELAKSADETLLSALVNKLHLFVEKSDTLKDEVDKLIVPLIEQFRYWIVQENPENPQAQEKAFERVLHAFSIFDLGKGYLEKYKVNKICDTLIGYLKGDKKLNTQSIFDALDIQEEDKINSLRNSLALLDGSRRKELQNALVDRHNALAKQYKEVREPSSPIFFQIHSQGYFREFQQSRVDKFSLEDLQVLFVLAEELEFKGMDELVRRSMNALRKLTSIITERENSKLLQWFEFATHIVVASGNNTLIDKLGWRLQGMIHEYAAEQLKGEKLNNKRFVYLKNCISTLLRKLPSDQLQKINLDEVFKETLIKKQELTPKECKTIVGRNSVFAKAAKYMKALEMGSDIFKKLLEVFYPNKNPKDSELKKKRKAFIKCRSEILDGKAVDWKTISDLTETEQKLAEILLNGLSEGAALSATGFDEKELGEFSKLMNKNVQDFFNALEKECSILEVMKLKSYLDKTLEVPRELEEKIKERVVQLVNDISTLVITDESSVLLQKKLDELSLFPDAGFALLQAVVDAYTRGVAEGDALLEKMKMNPNFNKYKSLKNEKDVIEYYLSGVNGNKYIESGKIKETLSDFVRAFPQHSLEIELRCQNTDGFSEFAKNIDNICVERYRELQKDVQNTTGYVYFRLDKFNYLSFAEAAEQKARTLLAPLKVSEFKEQCDSFLYPEKLNYLFLLKSLIEGIEKNNGKIDDTKLNVLINMLNLKSYEKYFIEDEFGKQFYNETARDIVKIFEGISTKEIKKELDTGGVVDRLRTGINGFKNTIPLPRLGGKSNTKSLDDSMSCNTSSESELSLSSPPGSLASSRNASPNASPDVTPVKQVDTKIEKRQVDQTDLKPIRLGYNNGSNG